MSAQTVVVYVSGHRVGQLASERGEYIFTYENIDQLDPLRDLVSLTMPVRLKSYSTQILMPPFQTNLPEGALLENLRKRFGKIIDTYDDLNLLKLVGQNMIGRVRFDLDKVPHKSKTSDTHQLRDLLSTSATRALFDELMEQFGPSSGVSGVQPKFLWHERDQKVSFTTENYIVKAAGQDYPGLAVNEYFSLQAARAAGMLVPDAWLSDSGEILIVKRFDCEESGDAVAFEEFCALLQYPNHGKYMASYEQIAEAILKIPCRPPQEVMKQYYLSVVFSMAVQNGDAHLKNFAVIYDRADHVRLAPFYDLVTTTVYLRKDVPALNFAGAKAWPDRAALIDFGITVCGMKRRQVLARIEEVRQGIMQTLPAMAQYAADHPRYAELLGRLAEVWRAGMQRYSA